MWHRRQHIFTLLPQKYISSVLCHNTVYRALIISASTLNIVLYYLIDDTIEIGSDDQDIANI